MVIGHAQVENEIGSFCGGHFTAIDTIISKTGFPKLWEEGKGAMTFFEMEGGKAYGNVVSEGGNKVEELTMKEEW
jgi:hypothetical protein